MKKLIPLTLVLLAGCQLAGSGRVVTARTDRNSYAVQDTVRFTITNESNETVRVSSDCSGIYYTLDRCTGAEWAPILTKSPTICPAIYGPIMLDPGEYTDDVMIAQTTGQLRLRFGVHGVGDGRAPMAFNTASNAFQVEM